MDVTLGIQVLAVVLLLLCDRSLTHNRLLQPECCFSRTHHHHSDGCVYPKTLFLGVPSRQPAVVAVRSQPHSLTHARRRRALHRGAGWPWLLGGAPPRARSTPPLQWSGGLARRSTPGRQANDTRTLPAAASPDWPGSNSGGDASLVAVRGNAGRLLWRAHGMVGLSRAQLQALPLTCRAWVTPLDDVQAGLARRGALTTERPSH